MLFRYCFCCLLLCALACTSQAEPKHYVVEGWIDEKDYVPTLLKLILNASKAPDEIIDLKYNKFYDLQLSHSRRVAEFAKLKGNLVMWTITNKEREAFLRPIRVPIFKGMFGYRCLVIRKEDQARFAAIKTQQELMTMVAGQGDQWPDTDVLRVNGFAVDTGTQVENLYKMLAAKRFDYFPRSVIEVEEELPMLASYNLMIAPNVMLEYPNPMYFFVQQTNSELAKRIERGWEIIINNGAFDQLFFNEWKVKAALQRWKTPPQYVFHLRVPELPSKTPLRDSRYWLRIPAVNNLLP